MSVNWRPWELEVFRRANGRCEYCGADMMASSDVYYWGRHFDHIQPDGGEGIENKAVACQPCNMIKRRRKSPISNGTREEIIAETAAWLKEKRACNAERLEIDRAWLRSFDFSKIGERVMSWKQKEPKPTTITISPSGAGQVVDVESHSDALRVPERPE
jgi:hypothetical protein